MKPIPSSELPDFYSRQENVVFNHVFGRNADSQRRFDIEDDQLLIGAGVQLGVNHGALETPWVHVGYMSNELKGVAELHILNPANILIGHTALIDTVRLSGGDSFVVGREKYPELFNSTSATHADFFADYTGEEDHGLIINVTDMNSKNGTGFLVHPEVEVAKAKELVAFTEKHQANYASLSPEELEDCYYAVEFFMTEYTNTGNEKWVIRAFNRKYHPDVAENLDLDIAGDKYKLIKAELENKLAAASLDQ